MMAPVLGVLFIPYRTSAIHLLLQRTTTLLRKKTQPERLTPLNRSGFGFAVQALKLSPQEQLVAALGFFTLKPPS